MVDSRRRAKYRKISCFNSERAGGEREIASPSSPLGFLSSLLMRGASQPSSGADEKERASSYVEGAKKQNTMKLDDRHSSEPFLARLAGEQSRRQRGGTVAAAAATATASN